MDITLPNGTVIEGVPEGTPKHVIAMRAIRAGLATNADFGYEGAEAYGGAADPSALENFRAGIGSGMVNVGRQVGNIFGLVEDETIAEQSRLDKDLLETKAGLGGRIVGEIAATAPVGGIGAGVAKGARALQLASKGGKYLTKTLQRGAGRAAVEGAAIGSVLAGPDQRGTGAAFGGVLGGSLGAAGTALGKALGKGSITKITKEAKQLQKMTGQFIPLSQSAEAGLTKQIYNALLANFPGVGGKIRGQYKEALDDLRRFVGEYAHPPKANIEIKATDTIEVMLNKLRSYWDDAFEEIKQWPVRAFSDSTPRASKSLARKILKETDGTVQVIVPGSQVTGAEILSLNTTLGNIIKQMSPSPAKAHAIAYQKGIHKLLVRNLNPSGKGRGAGARVLHEYEEAVKYYPPWVALQKAAKSAQDKIHFTPAQHLGKADTGSKVKNWLERRPGEQASKLGVEALEDFPSRQGLFQTVATIGVVGGGYLTSGATGLIVALPIAIMAGRVLASKGLQRFLSGQTKTQRLNKVLIRKYKKELEKLGATSRQAAVILGVENAT